MNTNTIIAGLDIGNGYVKGRFLGADAKTRVNIDIPSCTIGLSVAPAVTSIPSDEYIHDIFNRMICSFKSPIVNERRFVAFGKTAVTAGRSLTEFDIAAANFSKAQQDLSSLLVLGSVAGAAVVNYWDANHKLPDDILHVQVVNVLALPIDEFLTYREAFAQKFLNSKHEVTIHNFDKNVHIEIEFLNVNVMPEGLAAQMAITSKGVAFIQALLDDVRSRDANALPGITAENIIACTNTCGIDIGEGTVNIPVIMSKKFQELNSTTLQKGYGTVLEQAIPRVLASNIPYNTRKALADFLEREDSPFDRKKKATCRDIITSESQDLVNDIIKTISHVMSAGVVNVIYVYGGGATPMKEALYKPLLDKTTQFSGGDEVAVLYLDSSYSRNLNREGLFDTALTDAGMLNVL